MSTRAHFVSSRAALAALLFTAGCVPLAPSEGCPLDLAARVEVTELMADPPGPDGGGEWIELWNAGPSPVELGWLRLEVGGGAGAHSLTLPPGQLAPGAFLVLGDADAAALPAYVDQSYGDALGALRNSDGRVALRCGQRLLDELAYADVEQGRALARGGAGMDLAGGDGLVCAATGGEYAPDAWGSPGAPNPRCAVAEVDGGVLPGECVDEAGSRPASVTVPGDLVISELMADPSAVADRDGEWVELFVRRDVDLRGLGFGSDASGAASMRLDAERCLHFAAGSHVVVARSVMANGGLPRVDVVAPLALLNSGGLLVVSVDGVVLDSMSYGPSPGASLALGVDASGAYPDEGRALCPGVEAYGDGDRGSPGALNPGCGGAPVDGCRLGAEGPVLGPPAAGDVRIAELMPNPAAVADSAGEWVELRVGRDVNLAGLRFVAGSQDRPIAGEDCLAVAAGSLLVAREADPALNGGLPTVALRLPLGLSNEPGSLALVSGETTLDSVAWERAPVGAALVRDEAGALCEASATYGLGDRGTPGEADAGACGP